ncbi:MAG: hypothetical protein ACK56I_02785, partial [bacterium]
VAASPVEADLEAALRLELGRHAHPSGQVVVAELDATIELDRRELARLRLGAVVDLLRLPIDLALDLGQLAADGHRGQGDLRRRVRCWDKRAERGDERNRDGSDGGGPNDRQDGIHGALLMRAPIRSVGIHRDSVEHAEADRTRNRT